ncbi:Gfo/Idh/MocA family oxidoreductase [Pseudoalteromonas shioyasakiensis]|uniref:Gfo/Idh/MocA family protein n=1 Tax=Pseudoalteromonas shioyasakiensis TaxID=1190813 RepID=UPI002117817D|nr:Gfo/Idh/MocA family oxidoreductase [Pseudoalteromonas shioyasakiensis]MCQ8878499.1 Gfo/Idh/MocA family oxidoreductase [Pseudoalteromonas shioyasakiensis]
MTKQIRWGMIGCGVVTEVKSGPAYQLTDGFVINAVTRRDTALAEDYAKRHNVPLVFKTADELIASSEIDAVYIATPPDSHLEIALKVAAAGKPCCIEKPLAPTLAQSEAILTAFTAKKIPLFVAYYRRSLPRFNKVKRLIDDGEIGAVRHVNWHLSKASSDVDKSGEYNWRTDKQVALGGYFDDLASHGLDLFGYLFGEYQSVKGLATNQQNLYNAFDAISACWQHKNGITGSGSWNFGGFSRFDIVTVYGEKGEITFSVFDEQAIKVVNAQGQQVFTIENPTHVQQYHVENMASALLDDTIHPSTGYSATHTSWVMEQILS